MGYAALIDAYNLPVPVPRALSAIGAKHRIIEQADWHIYTPRHAPEASLEGHLTFALKYEGLDLALLKRLFIAAAEAYRGLYAPHLVLVRMAAWPRA